MASYAVLEWNEYNTDVITRLVKLKAQEVASLNLDPSYLLQNPPPLTITNQTASSATLVAQAVLNEDFSMDFRSNFTSAGDLIGGTQIGSLVRDITKWEGILSGTTTDLVALFDFQLWDKTEPIKLNFEVMFTLRTNAELDVFMPAMSLCSLTTLTQGKDGTYYVPGIHFSNLGTVLSQGRGTTNDRNTGGNDASALNVNRVDQNAITNMPKSKFLKIRTTTFDYPIMLVLNAKPTFSKISDENEYPIWAKVNLELQTLFPASSDMLFSKK